jgi:hypothetical protein
VTDWVHYLRIEKLWGLADPLFPRTRVAVGASRHFEAVGLDRNGWRNATPIRAIFKDAFTGAGLPYFNPHSFRKTLAQFGERVCETPEAFKAWSQNLGHENVLTTFASYGQVATPRQAELMRELGSQSAKSPIPEPWNGCWRCWNIDCPSVSNNLTRPKINRISVRWYPRGTPANQAANKRIRPVKKVIYNTNSLIGAPGEIRTPDP